MKQLNVVVPGLLGPFADELPTHIAQEFKQPEFKLINKYFARADVQGSVADSYYQTLIDLMGSEKQTNLCQLTAEYDGLDISNGYFYRADPVHFKAESDHAILVGADQVLPNKDETKQLIDCFNQHFLEDKISLYSTHENRWYLKSERALNLKFTALDYALARDIKHFMPQDITAGEDALWWRKILNEAQMLFFQHAVNQARESNGQLTINGLWLWDSSLVKEEDSLKLPEQVFSNDVVALALAKQAAIKIHSMDAFSKVESTAVVVLDQLYQSVCYGDVDAWLEAVRQFCKNELLQINDLLLSKKIDEVNFYSCTGKVFKINKFKLLKFWKPNTLFIKHLVVL